MFNNFKCKVLGLPLFGLMVLLSPWSFSWAKCVVHESVTNQERDWIAIVFACAADKVPAVLMQNGTPGKNTAESSFWQFQQPQLALSAGSALPSLLCTVSTANAQETTQKWHTVKTQEGKMQLFSQPVFWCVTVFNHTLAEMGSVVRNLCIWVFILTVQG